MRSNVFAWLAGGGSGVALRRNRATRVRQRHHENCVTWPGGAGLYHRRLTDADYYLIVVIMIGEFEYLILASTSRLGEGAYGLAIREQIEGVAARRCSPGALYTTLDRLERKGLVRTWMGDATPQRGGRAKRMVRVTARGERAAKAFYDAVIQSSRGVSWEAARTRP